MAPAVVLVIAEAIYTLVIDDAVERELSLTLLEQFDPRDVRKTSSPLGNLLVGQRF